MKKPFEEILEILGAENPTRIKKAQYWDFWEARFPTPAGTMIGYYLYLKHKCPKSEIISTINRKNWDVYSKNNKYDVITTPKSPLVKQPNLLNRTFTKSKIRTSKQILFDNFIKNFNRKSFDTIDFFIDPDMEVDENKPIPKATNFLMKWLSGDINGEEKSSIAVLIANAGVGKTTVSRVLSKMLSERKELTIPLLIESDQWRDIIDRKITIRKVWDEALRRRFENAGNLLSNDKALRVLIREGVFSVIFDGFDELCVAPSSEIKPSEIIDHLNELLAYEDETVQSRIIVTSRSTFWSSVAEGIDNNNIKIFKLKAFDHDKRKYYFRNRLKDPVEQDTAFRISKEISGFYDGINKELFNEDRLSGVPFILDLIARYVEGNSSVKTGNPYQTDPFEKLLTDICIRENTRQKYNIKPNLQFEFFQELFRAFPQDFTLKDIIEYAGLIFGKTDDKFIDSFISHTFFKTSVKKGYYEPRYEVLKVYFIARYLAKSFLSDIKGKTRRAIVSLLAEQNSSKTQLIELLVTQLKLLTEAERLAAIHHAIRLINEDPDEKMKSDSLISIFYLVDGLIEKKDKKFKTNELLKFYNTFKVDDLSHFESIGFSEQITGYDFSNVEFKGCLFQGAEFKNCVFNDKTVFINCSFTGPTIFKNCKNANSITDIDCTFSDESLYSIRKIQNSGISLEVKQSLAQEIITTALKRFRSDAGFVPIQFIYRNSGLNSGNPFKDNIWDVLLENGIVSKHRISGVKEGGLHITDDKKIRNDINFYFDSGVLGKRLERVRDHLIK